MKLPKIKDSYNLTLNNDFFLTSSDDVGFAMGQLRQLQNKIKARKDRKLHPWERKANNIYTSYENKSKSLIKSKRNNTILNQISDWGKFSIFNPTEISDIEETIDIKRNIKTKYDIKYKYKDREQTFTDFISTKNDTFMANTVIQLLKDKKTNMLKKYEGYSRSLRHQILLLDKDINKFGNFTLDLDKKKKTADSSLNKCIIENKNLVNLYKKQLQEYNSTIYDIYKILKSMNDLKFYAKFIHKLLGGDNDILHCDLISNVSFKDFKNYDIYSITQNILKQTKNLINTETNRDFTDEIHNFDLSFKDMEDKLVKLFIKKHGYVTDINDIKKEGELFRNKRQTKYDSLNEDYESLLKELNQSIQKYNKISLSPEEEDIIKFNYALLIEFFTFLFPKSGGIKDIKELKVENAYDLKSDVVAPIILELNNLQNRVDGLLKEMEECSHENNALFEKYLNKRKNENRALKLLYEKNIIKMKEELKVKKYDDKMKRIIIKNRNKYNLKQPVKNIKIKPNKYVKTEINIEDVDFLYY